MFDTWLFLLFLQGIVASRQNTSLPLPIRSAPITTTEKKNVTIADHACIPPANLCNDMSLIFTEPGDPIPAAELRYTLSVASARVQAYLPRHANEPISDDFFETNLWFPDTRDGVSLSVYSYGLGLSWLQLSHGLLILQEYMLGLGPGHPVAHFQQLQFYIRTVAEVDVAYGVVDFTPGGRAVGKRNSVTTTLQLPNTNFSSSGTVNLPIVFRIPKTNLDLYITSLGEPIPEYEIFHTIESAFTEIILNHTDIDALIPADRPFSFNETSGKSPKMLTTTEIQISVYPDKKISWGVLCLLIYGLRDFLRETKFFNTLKFEIFEGKVGWIGHGDVLYGPTPGTASTRRLNLGKRSRSI